MQLNKPILMLAAAFACSGAQADATYPNRPIQLVVPFTPGSSSDVTARAIAQKISGPLGQPVVVDNKPGANGGIGMQAVARSKADGYTLVVGTGSSTVGPSIISKNVPFDLFKDFTPVATMANTPSVFTGVSPAPCPTFRPCRSLGTGTSPSPDGWRFWRLRARRSP